MNLKLVLRTYSALRQLTDDETALLETLRSMTDAERELTVETLSPQVKSTKKAGKKGAGKSRRGQSLSETVKGNLQRREPTIGGFADDVDYLADKCSKCPYGSDHNIHHLATAAGYHEFTAAKDDNYEMQTAAGD